jgi:hypothetical protein
MEGKLTPAMLAALRRYSGDKTAPLPYSRWAQERTNRALLDRGLINPIGWTLTEAGRAALQQNQPHG